MYFYALGTAKQTRDITNYKISKSKAIKINQ